MSEALPPSERYPHVDASRVTTGFEQTAVGGEATCQQCGRPVKQTSCTYRDKKVCTHDSHCLCKRPSLDSDATIVGTVDGYDVTGHTARRYRERAESEAPLNVTEAIEAAVSVGVPDYIDGHGLWYPPERVLFVRRDGAYKTVLPFSSPAVFTTDHLVNCHDCSRYYDPGRNGDCHWCGGDTHD